jgi:uncharacterized damage-inducible protein DinB
MAKAKRAAKAKKKTAPRSVKPKAKAKKPASKKASSANRAAPSAMPGPGKQFLDVFTREHVITMKVMRAFPADQHAFQPHARSQSAKRLMGTLATEQGLVLAALDGTLKMPPNFPPEPATLAEVMLGYEAGVKNVAGKVARTPDAKLSTTVPFFVGPGKLGEVPILDLMWLMLMDSIHHRGQLSVYVRMAGGLVPSIYGPSADEPWM